MSLVLLLYFLGIVAVITLAPFQFAGPAHVSDLFKDGGWFDDAANVLLFLPLGFLYPLTRPAEETSPARVFFAGVLLSAAIEMTQAYEPGRFSSVIDVLTNATGAALGALLFAAVTKRIRVNARLVGRLSLEIPLIGLVYLLVPLLLVASLPANDTPSHLLALIPLALLGSRLMTAVQRYHFGPPRAFSNRAMGAFAAGWAALSAFPAVLRYPVTGIGVSLAIGLMTWYESSVPVSDGSERRFETDALRGAAPYMLMYFLVVLLLPLANGVGDWHVELGLTGSSDDPAQQMLRLLEPVASLTLLGYMLAEARGRGERPFRSIVPRLAVECAAVAAAVEGSRAFQPAVGASAVEFAGMIAAGLLGAGIYHKQRAHVQWILIHRPPTPNQTIAVEPRPVPKSRTTRGLARVSELSRL